jgi:C4-dicarboxylate transporter DctM subunit
VGWKQLYGLVVEAGYTSGMVLFLAATSTFVGFVLDRDLVPSLLVQTITAVSTDRYVVLLLLNLLFIATGILLEAPAVIVGFLPSVVPLLRVANIDPIQWAVIFVVNAGIGMIHPPVGLTFFVSTAIARVPLGPAVRAIVPFMAIMLVDLVLLSLFPQIPLLLPHVLYGYPIR